MGDFDSKRSSIVARIVTGSAYRALDGARWPVYIHQGGKCFKERRPIHSQPLILQSTAGARAYQYQYQYCVLHRIPNPNPNLDPVCLCRVCKSKTTRLRASGRAGYETCAGVLIVDRAGRSFRYWKRDPVRIKIGEARCGGHEVMDGPCRVCGDLEEF